MLKQSWNTQINLVAEASGITRIICKYMYESERCRCLGKNEIFLEFYTNNKSTERPSEKSDLVNILESVLHVITWVLMLCSAILILNVNYFARCVFCSGPELGLWYLLVYKTNIYPNILYSIDNLLSFPNDNHGGSFRWPPTSLNHWSISKVFRVKLPPSNSWSLKILLERR